MSFPKFISAITVVTIFSCSTGSAQAAFTDLSATSRYATAIEYLSTAGIIGGYSDGSFRPGNLVNRAEFLKLAIESSGIRTDSTNQIKFSDIDETAWYAKYVRKAYGEGWVKGYDDGSFRPENPITKAEGLKMIGEIQEWKTPSLSTPGPFGDTPAGQWFTPFVTYAKEHNFLEENGKFYIPEALLTRERTAEILFRTYATKLNDAENYSTRFALTPPPPATKTVTVTEPTAGIAENAAFTPVDFLEYPANFFEGVTLSETFPNTFYINELYYFEGTTGKSGDKAFVFMAPGKETDTSKYILNVAEMNNGKFRIPVYFRKTGNYRLGLIPGTTKESNILDISVLPSLPENAETKDNIAPSDPRISYSEGNSTISWDGNENGLIRVSVFQGAKTKQFIFRQGISSFPIPFAEFDGFTEDQTGIRVEGTPLASEKPLALSGGWKKSDTVYFSATGHHFTENDETGLSIMALPGTYYDSKSISFTGTAKTEIFAEAAITKPDGSVEMVKITSTLPYGEYYSSQTITAKSGFTFRYKPTTANGTYFIEINGIDGKAVLNYPVYLKGQIPLIPDFIDLATYSTPEDSMGLEEMRTKLLDLINTDRTAAGLQTVKMDATLTNLAQLHSEDMVNRDFFGHINPDKEWPEDRRIAMGIPTPVGENIAQTSTIAKAHNGLMRSGIHRANILTPEWTKLGIGITRDSQGYLFVTEEFSTEKLTEIDLINYKKEILQKINTERIAQGMEEFTQDLTLSQIADNWSENMASQNFLGFTSPAGEILDTTIRASIKDRSVYAQLLESPDMEKIVQGILAGEGFSTTTLNTIGIGLKVDNIGTLKATLFYST